MDKILSYISKYGHIMYSVVWLTKFLFSQNTCQVSIVRIEFTYSAKKVAGTCERTNRQTEEMKSLLGFCFLPFGHGTLTGPSFKR